MGNFKLGRMPRATWQSEFSKGGGWSDKSLLEREQHRKRFGVPRASSLPQTLLGELERCDHPFQQAAVLAKLSAFMVKRSVADAAANRKAARAAGCVPVLVPLLRAPDSEVAGGAARGLQHMCFDVPEAVDELLAAESDGGGASAGTCGRGILYAVALLRRPVTGSFGDPFSAAAAAARLAAAGLLQNVTASSNAAVSAAWQVAEARPILPNPRIRLCPALLKVVRVYAAGGPAWLNSSFHCWPQPEERRRSCRRRRSRKTKTIWHWLQQQCKRWRI